MITSNLFPLLIVIGIIAYIVGRRKAITFRDKGEAIHSLPTYYGYMMMLWALIPAVMILLLWLTKRKYIEF